jgi:hypothetical protein
MHAPVQVWISFYASAMVDILSMEMFTGFHTKEIHSAWHSFNIWVRMQAHSLEKRSQHTLDAPVTMPCNTVFFFFFFLRGTQVSSCH